MKGTIRTRANPQRGDDAIRDPITGAPAAHLLGAGLGATGGALAGAAIGAVAGPIGAAVGLVAGGVAGALGGKVLVEKGDPTAEDAYWKANYARQKYVDRDAPYDTYQPAYRTGYVGRTRYPGRTFEEVEADLESDYPKVQGQRNSELG